MPFFVVMKVLIQLIWLLLFNSATTLPQGLVGEGSIFTEAKPNILSQFFYKTQASTSDETTFVVEREEVELEEEDDSDDEVGTNLIPNFSVFYYTIASYFQKLNASSHFLGAGEWINTFPVFLRHCSLLI